MAQPGMPILEGADMGLVGVGEERRQLWSRERGRLRGGQGREWGRERKKRGSG